MLQTCRVIESFLNLTSTLQDLMMDHYANDFSNEQCSCGRGARLVRCHDCFQHSTTCRRCFVEQHRHSPFHWALVWDQERHHFSKLDYSFVLPEEFVVQLG